jgi:hypothetical protein
MLVIPTDKPKEIVGACRQKTRSGYQYHLHRGTRVQADNDDASDELKKKPALKKPADVPA